MLNVRLLSGFFAAALLIGCASKPQTPLALADTIATDKTVKMGVLFTELPKADTGFPGAGCLLCLATASIANSALTKHTKTLDTKDLAELQDELVAVMKKRGLNAIVVNEKAVKLDSFPKSNKSEANFSKYDYSQYQKKYGINRLLVVNFDSIGILRNYSAYIAVGEPFASISGTAFIVNLNTHAYDWYTPINVIKPSTGAWDQGPNYPNLTNAYYQAIEMTKDQLKMPFQK